MIFVQTILQQETLHLFQSGAQYSYKNITSEIIQINNRHNYRGISCKNHSPKKAVMIIIIIIIITFSAELSQAVCRILRQSGLRGYGRTWKLLRWRGDDWSRKKTQRNVISYHLQTEYWITSVHIPPGDTVALLTGQRTCDSYAAGLSPGFFHCNNSKVVTYLIISVGHGADPGFLAVSPQVTLVINPVVGCRYFPPGPQLLSQPRRSPSLVGTKLYCLVTEAHRCK